MKKNSLITDMFEIRKGILPIFRILIYLQNGLNIPIDDLLE